MYADNWPRSSSAFSQVKRRSCGSFLTTRKPLIPYITPTLWNTLRNFGFPQHITWLLGKLYDNASGVIKIGERRTEPFPLGKVCSKVPCRPITCAVHSGWRVHHENGCWAGWRRYRVHHWRKTFVEHQVCRWHNTTRKEQTGPRQGGRSTQRGKPQTWLGKQQQQTRTYEDPQTEKETLPFKERK